MPRYTVIVEGGNATGDVWQALSPAEIIDTTDTAADVARWTADNQTVAEGDRWRVRVWEGADADQATAPAAEWRAGE